MITFIVFIYVEFSSTGGVSGEEMFLSVWYYVTNWNSKKALKFFVFLLRWSSGVGWAWRKPKLPFKKWCFIFMTSAFFSFVVSFKS